jgi:mono/diheme cytochrome c family protein
MNRHMFAAVFLALGLSAQAAPFDKGDPGVGKTLVGKHCVSCHVSQFGGDGSGVYTRPDHHIQSADQLKQQIGRCNKGAQAGLSDKQQLDVGAYLNQSFYKFK